MVKWLWLAQRPKTFMNEYTPCFRAALTSLLPRLTLSPVLLHSMPVVTVDLGATSDHISASSILN